MTNRPDESGSERKIERLILAMEDAEGSRSNLYQALPTSALEYVDPFLLFQEFGAGSESGAALPYRGFELLTYVTDGTVSISGDGIASGSVSASGLSLLRVGRGLSVSETASGTSQGFRVWLNLPASAKYEPAQQFQFTSSQLPLVEIAGVESKVRVLVGEFHGEESPVRTVARTQILDFEVAPGAEVFQKIPQGWNAFVYVYFGSGRFGSGQELVSPRQMAVFTATGSGVRVFNDPVSPALRFLLVTGQPLDEPVARSGGYVMNTDAEIAQAFRDFAR